MRMDLCVGVVCLLMCGVPKAVTPIWWEIRVTVMAVSGSCRVWTCRGWGMSCQVGDVQCGGCAMWMDLCVGVVCLLVVWCAKSRYSDLGDLSNGYGVQGAGVGV